MSDDLLSLLSRSVENPTARTPLGPEEQWSPAEYDEAKKRGAPPIVPPERQAWLDERRKGVGGSDIPKILGLDPHGGPLEVFLSKVENFDSPESEDSIRGQVLEPGVLDWYARRLGVGVQRNTHSFKHPNDRWMARCTHDALATIINGDSSRLVSVKCPRRGGDQWGDFDGSTRFPPNYALQLQYEWAVLTAYGFRLDPLMHLAALVDGDLRIYHCEADTELQGVLLEQAGQWWEKHVVAKVPPELDGSDGARAWIRRRFPGDSKPVRPASLDEEVLLEQMSEAAQLVATAEAQFATARQKVEETIGEASGITGARVSVTWRASKKTGRRTFRVSYPWEK